MTNISFAKIPKHVTAERIKLLIQPEDINALFQRLGASPKAMALSDPIVADAHPTRKEHNFQVLRYQSLTKLHSRTFRETVQKEGSFAVHFGHATGRSRPVNYAPPLSILQTLTYVPGFPMMLESVFCISFSVWH